MNRAAAVRHAIHEMELAGLEFTADELAMWDKIASGELPLMAASDAAAEFDYQARQSHPQFFKKEQAMSEKMNETLAKQRVDFVCEKCGKTVGVQADIFIKIYAGETQCLDCRQAATKEKE